MIAMRAVVVVLASLVLAGCAHNKHRAVAEAAYYNAQAQAQVSRAPIVELVARPGEAIVLQGVERFAVFAPNEREGVRQYQAGPNPWIQAVGAIADVGLKGYGVYQLSGFARAAVTHAGGNVAITNSGRMNSAGDEAGGDLIHGNRIDNTGRIGSDGDDIAGDRIDNTGRIGSDGDDVGGDQIYNRGRWNSDGDDRDDSPGPIDDRGDCRNGADCSAPQPPAEPGDD